MMNTLVNIKVAMIEPQGYINAANNDAFLSQLIQTVRQNQNSTILVNMRKVEFLDSAGLMSLVKAFRLAQSLGHRFTLCSVVPSVRMVFELTQLDKVFEIFDDRDSFEQSLN